MVLSGGEPFTEQNVGPITDQLNQRGQTISQDFNPILQGKPVLGSFKKGGVAKKTGLYKLHRGEKVMGKLTTSARKHISKGKFGVPSKAPASGSYPMPDRSHAVNAMARASGKGVEAQVRAKAHKLYPGLGSVSNLRRAK
jgi:hypothetical protein